MEGRQILSRKFILFLSISNSFSAKENNRVVIFSKDKGKDLLKKEVPEAESYFERDGSDKNFLWWNRSRGSKWDCLQKDNMVKGK